MIGETIRSQNGFHRTWKQAVRTSDEIQCDRLGTECGNSQSEVQTTMNQYGEWRMHKGGTKKSAEEKSKKDFGTQNDTWYLLRRVWQFWTQLAKKTESEVISQQVYRSFWGVALVIQIMQWLIFLFNPVKLGQCLHVNKRKVSTMEHKHMWTMKRFVDWNKNPQDVCDGSCSSRFGCLCGNLLRKSLVVILDLALVKISFATTQHVVVPNSRA